MKIEISYRIWGKDIFEGDSEDEAFAEFFDTIGVDYTKVEIDTKEVID